MQAMKTQGNYMLTWLEDHTPNIGEGVSRTNNPSARLFQVVVSFGGAPPLTDHIRAMNKKQAEMFAKNRYPQATQVNVIGKSN